MTDVTLAKATTKSHHLRINAGVVLLSLVLASLMAAVLAGCTVQVSTTTTPNDGLTEAEVVRVVDGDTLILNVNGENERVRLIGINCPESVAQEVERNSEEGVEASDYTKSLVMRGDTVWLETDTNDRDQYDRLLRYVWLEQPADVNDLNEIGTKMLNGILVREGYAQAHRYGDDDLHIDELRELGREAIDEGRGVTYVWAN